MKALQLLSVLLLLGPTGAFAADDVSQRALALASELERNLEEALALSDVAPPQATAMQQRTREAAVTEMHGALELARDLTSQLQLGRGLPETQLRFVGLRRAIRGALESAGKAVPQSGVAERLERVDQLLLELSRLYEAA